MSSLLPYELVYKMIPKTIHYCWFGRNPLPKSAVKCINSWRKFFPDYEIKEWNEDNFDVNMIPYTADAYAAKKYAFVSDYARFWVLYHYGGVYFDTDVEVISSMDDIICRGAFMGIEVPAGVNMRHPMVAPGLGVAVEAGHEIYKRALEHYEKTSFVVKDGVILHESIVPLTTRLLIEYGMEPNDDMQEVSGIWIYPKDFFNPYDDLTGVLSKTKNTRSIHWYSATWQNGNRYRKWLSRIFHRVFGTNLNEVRTRLDRLKPKS